MTYDDVYREVDLAAIAYDDGVHPKHRLTRYHDFFVERVKPGDLVLDIGSGKGELAYDLVTRGGASVVGVDHDPSHLSFARSHFRHERLEFREGDVLERIPAGRFDVVVLSNVLEHLSPRVEFLRGLLDSAAAEPTPAPRSRVRTRLDDSAESRGRASLLLGIPTTRSSTTNGSSATSWLEPASTSRS